MATLQYGDYIITTFEREPGKWHATITRLDGRDIKILLPGGGSRPSLTTSFATYSEEAAINEAKATIDGKGMQ
jgi:hypothetical protein